MPGVTFKDVEDDPYLEEAVREFAEKAPRLSGNDQKVKEMLAQKKEEDLKNAGNRRWHNQDELKGIRLGRLLHHSEFLRLLNKKVKARYGSYRRGLLGLEVFIATETGGEWKYICGVQAGLAPEYSTLYFDEMDVPTSEMYRGWRTVLLRLIFNNVLTEYEAEKVFGPAEGPEADRYRRTLYAFRNK